MLEQFLSRARQEGWPTELGTNMTTPSWSSPISSLPTSSHFSLPTLLLDQAMTLCYYAAALQEQAYAIMQSAKDAAITPSSTASTAPIETLLDRSKSLKSPHLAAVAILRKAAGVYAHIRDVILPVAMPDIPKKGAPWELSPQILGVLESIALAQAQGVAASRAEAKGASPVAVGAVHRGCVELYEVASVGIKELPSSKVVSERLRRWLALSAELHVSKALKAQAAVCREEQKLGVASACLRDALARMQRCVAVAEKSKDSEWHGPLKEELHDLECMFEVFEKERTVAYMQGVAGGVPPPLAGKIVVTAAEYEMPAANESFFL